MDQFAKYLATQIQQNKLDEKKVYELYPEYKNQIESMLKEWNNEIPTLDE